MYKSYRTAPGKISEVLDQINAGPEKIISVLYMKDYSQCMIITERPDPIVVRRPSGTEYTY